MQEVFAGLRLVVLFLLAGAVPVRGADAAEGGKSEAWRDAPKVSVRILDWETFDLPERPVAESEADERYSLPAFGFTRLPRRYVASGVPADRPTYNYVEATAQVPLPAGKHQLLVRSLGQSRLTIDGQVVVETPPMKPKSSIGDDPFEFGPLLFENGVRLPAPGAAEGAAAYRSSGGVHEIRWEILVGARFSRPEIPETTVSIRLEQADEFFLVSPNLNRFPHSDAGWEAYARSQEAVLLRLEVKRRQEAFARVADYWERRHAYARSWVDRNPGPEVPSTSKNSSSAEGQGSHPIDRFLAAAAEPTLVAGADERPPKRGVTFQQVQRLLSARCLRCHRGEKAQGGFRLDDPESLYAETGSGDRGVVPGHPHESALFGRITSEDEFARMPPPDGGRPFDKDEIDLVRIWIEQGARRTAPSPSRGPLPCRPLTDLEFLRKATVDTTGVVPSLEEIRDYLAIPTVRRRSWVIDRLLEDPRWADNWTPYWQNVLAENPNLMNPTLNNTGPFRFWIHESLMDERPFDLFVTELLQMEGGYVAGGPKGFEMASQNDAPFAEKGVIVTGAFLGINARCARCHDAPFHRSTQADLFSLAAALQNFPLTVPPSSSVNLAALVQGGRKPLISVSLPAGSTVDPAWSLTHLVTEEIPAELLPENHSWRDRLAIQITRPENERFPKVIVNRVWARLFGRGLAEPVDDWEIAEIVHPELLAWLAREFVRSGYDFKSITRHILSSQHYQQSYSDDGALGRRRLEAAQVADSLASVFGKRLTTERMNFDLNVSRSGTHSLDLGEARRCWQLANLGNERDRPTLTLPETQGVVDTVQSFGWRSARMEPWTPRPADLDVTQPASLGNGMFVERMIRVTPGSNAEALAFEDRPVESLIDDLFLLVYTRLPLPEEQQAALQHLEMGYADRIVPGRTQGTEPARANPLEYVTWSNQFTPGANELAMQRGKDAERGPLPSNLFQPAWRERLEDLLWALVNSPEFQFLP